MALQILYVAAFSAAAAVCFLSMYYAGGLDSNEASIGLRALLGTVGLWAAIQTLQLLATTEALLVSLYLVGQSVGFATVGIWLYFCSAYTGRAYHRQARYWLVGGVTYLLVTFLKLTNPVHHLYLETQVVTEPFMHITIQPGLLFWVVLAFSYVAVFVGFYLLFELLFRSDQSTGGVSLFVVAAALPIVLKPVAYFGPDVLVPIHYEPLGVAVFALGTLYLTTPTFFGVHEEEGYVPDS